MPIASTPESRERLARMLLWLAPALWTVNYLVARTAPGIVQPHVLALGRWALAGSILVFLARHELARHRLHLAQAFWQYLALGTLGMIAASAAFAALTAGALGLAPATFVLGTSPGGIAEMCVTAKVLQLGVPAATAPHVVRYLVVLIITRPLWVWEARRLGIAGV